MPGKDLLESFDRLAGQVRHPGLTLDLFISQPLDNRDDPLEDGADGEAIGAAPSPQHSWRRSVLGVR